MQKVLGIPLGPGETTFQIMQSEGINVDYAISEMTRNNIGFSSAITEFQRKEKEVLANGKLNEYFETTQSMPDFWSNYIGNTFTIPFQEGTDIEKEIIRNTRTDINEYDIIAFSVYDEYFSPLKSAIKYLGDNFRGKVMIGGQIVREKTIPTLKKISDKVLLNRGSFNNFKRIVEGTHSPSGNVIENDSVLKIDSYDTLVRSGLIRPECGDINNDSVLIEPNEGEKLSALNVIGIAGCLNNCSYCYSPNSINVPEGVWIQSIDRLSKESNTAYVNILDSNPLQFLPPYERIISKAYEKFDGVILNSFVDPSVLSSSSEKRDFLRSVIKSPKTGYVSLFAGRECTSERGAKSIGRKYMGKLRRQSDLDEEKKAIEHLIGDLESTKKLYRLRIAYVLSPGGPDQLEVIQREIRHFEGMGRGVRTQIQPLNAYPGAECHEVYRKDLMSEFPGVLMSNIASPNILEYEKTI